MPITSVINTNRYSIDRVLNAGPPVLLIFWQADRPLAPDLSAALEDAAARYAGKLLIARVDAQEESELVRRFSVSALPALVAVQGGRAQETVAPLTPAAVQAWVAHLAEGAPRPSAPPQPAPGDAPVVLKDATFQSTISGPGPVLVDFWAPWCGPCRMIAPSVERLAREYAGKAVIAKLNVDENQITAQRYGVQGIPTLLIFRHGQVVDQIVGAQPYDLIKQHLLRYIQ